MRHQTSGGKGGIGGIVPGQQWNSNGGFCGAFSTQHAALSVGAWISQDLVRKANRDQPGEHNMHGDTTVGYEVVPINAEYTATKLKLTHPRSSSGKPATLTDCVAWSRVQSLLYLMQVLSGLHWNSFV